MDGQEHERPRKKLAVSDSDSSGLRKPTAKPDPFFKAKKKAEAVKREREQVEAERQRQRAHVAEKVSNRKKRHVKLSQRTASGQPVVKHHITDILSRLQSEQKEKSSGK